MTEEQKSSLPTGDADVAGESATAKRILIVDDDDAVRESLYDFLEFHNFAVAAVASARQALEVLNHDAFDLILSDLVMPQMDGISLTKAIRESGKDVPVLVMTGFASIEYAVESMKAGATDFITKPLKFDHVLLVIQRTLESSNWRKMAREREYYKDLSNSDGLTKISNYRHFSQLLQLELDRQRRYHRPLTLLMIDIDDFKKTNDCHGHLMGDMVLIQIAELLSAEIRGFDLVARYGGDEFTVILPEVSSQEALVVGRRILKAIGTHAFTTAAGKEIGGIGVTIGVASFPKDATEGQALVSMADQAMYAGKSGGKNCICVFGEEKNIIRTRKPTASPQQLKK
jgi:diguanylate cyclase (GGDEF)-like protein